MRRNEVNKEKVKKNSLAIFYKRDTSLMFVLFSLRMHIRASMCVIEFIRQRRRKTSHSCYKVQRHENVLSLVHLQIQTMVQHNNFRFIQTSEQATVNRMKIYDILFISLSFFHFFVKIRYFLEKFNTYSSCILQQQPINYSFHTERLTLHLLYSSGLFLVLLYMVSFYFYFYSIYIFKQPIFKITNVYNNQN